MAEQNSLEQGATIVYSTLSAGAVLQLISRHYSVEGHIECCLFHRGTSDTYLLSTSKRRFAVKLYRANWRSREAILSELSALHHLATRGVDVALPVARLDGGLITDIHAPEGVRSAVIFHWIEGPALSYADAEQTRDYGKLIGKLHEAGDDLALDAARPRMDMRHLLERPLQHLTDWLDDLPSARRRLGSLGERLRARLSCVETSLADWGFCHGDVWSGNVRLDGKRLVLFDFDFCGPGWRVADLASYRRQAREQGEEAMAWAPFIDGYLQIRPAAVGSLQFIGPFMIMRQLWIASQLLSRAAEIGVGFQTAETVAGSLLPFCERIEFEVR